MKYFCINMPGADERRTHCEAEFVRAGIDVTYINGIDGKKSKLSHALSWITPGHIGCALSHIMLAEHVRCGDDGISIVLEDDAVMNNAFKELLPQRLASLPADWDVAMIGWIADEGRYDLIQREPAGDDWFRLCGGNVWGTNAYAINGRKGAECLLRCITPITSHIDRMFNESAKEGKLNSYFLTEQLVWPQWTFASQTQG